MSDPPPPADEDRRKGERRRAHSPDWLHLLGGALSEDRRKGERRAPATAVADVLRAETRRRDG